jgi:hypothetical protein
MPTEVNPGFSSASSRPVPAVICEVSDSSDDLDGSGPDDVSLIDSVAFHSWKKIPDDAVSRTDAFASERRIHDDRQCVFSYRNAYGNVPVTGDQKPCKY